MTMTETIGYLNDREDGRDPSTKSVLSKVFLMLESFRGQETLTLTELATRSGVPKTTVHRLAAALVEWGALERVYGEYRLGLRLFELGGSVPRWRIIREAALPFMQDLLKTTHETIHLAILDGRHVLYLEKIHGHRAPSIVSRYGGRLPAHCTALGKALLAFSGDEARAEVFRQPLERRTPHTITVPAVLRAELEETGRRGYAIDREEGNLGVQCVAAPILNPRGKAVAALSTSVPSDRFEPDRLAPPVRAAATGVAHVLAPFAYII
jgi:DNA-binding IclR family transcriptional regulator